jgi:carbonic anhydrase
VNDQPAGCAALKRFDDITCELKRLYVRPDKRGHAIEQRLIVQVLDDARKSGYKRVILSSHIAMSKAHELYLSIGFRTVNTPDDFPEELKPFVVFMEYRM